LEVEEV